MILTPLLSGLNSAESRSGSAGQSGGDGIKGAVLMTRLLAACNGKLGWKHGKRDSSRSFSKKKVANRLIKPKTPRSSGRVAEWLKASDSKSEVVARLPWVRIPPLPPFWNAVPYSIVALCSSGKLGDKTDEKQPIAFLSREKVCDLGDGEIHRYRIFGNGWDWGYLKCRIQLKAMARMIDKILNDRIPMYQVRADVLKSVESGSLVPRQCLRGPQLDNMSLEDFALSPDESAQSKEADELSQVIEYIKYHDLENVANRALNGKLW